MATPGYSNPADNGALADTAAPNRAGPDQEVGVAIPLAALALAETVAIAAVLLADVSPLLPLLLVHAAALALAGAAVVHARRRGRDATYLVIGLIAGTAIGPLGFAGAGLLGQTGGRRNTPSPLIEQWYERIALSTLVPPEERLCDDVGAGRTLDVATEPPISFPAAMVAGTLAEQQAILGQIARNFDPAYLATLKIALASPEPVIRVQAAAVAAHIGPRLRTLLADRIAAASRGPSEPLSALTLLDDLEALLGSGLLDEDERKRAAALAGRLGDSVITALARGPIRWPRSTDPAQQIRVENRLEQVLIQRGRFVELRAQRTATRLAGRHPHARFKRLTIGARAESAAP